ncbi:MAG TPA: DUF4239 domain-containing protein [Stellaceae bacterium]|nr:DUF4239 domain-containing protein [Stellaceae bacterium]
MAAPWLALITFGLVFAGALIGALLRLVLPQHHLEEESRDVLKVVVALTATLSAVLFSLLIASAKNFYDAQTAEVQVLASKIVLLDRVLAVYGPEASQTRADIRTVVVDAVERIWPSKPTESSDLQLMRADGPGMFFSRIAALTPQTEVQKVAQAQAIQVAISLSEIRFLMFTQRINKVPVIFVSVLLFWVVVLFSGYGLLTRLNGTVLTVLLVSALSVGLAMYLIVEFNHPFDGAIRIPGSIMHDALAQMGQP